MKKNIVIAFLAAGMLCSFYIHFQTVETDRKIIEWIANASTNVVEQDNLNMLSATFALQTAQKIKELDDCQNLALQVDENVAYTLQQQGIFNSNVTDFITDQRKLNKTLVEIFLFDEYPQASNKLKQLKI